MSTKETLYQEKLDQLPLEGLQPTTFGEIIPVLNEQLNAKLSEARKRAADSTEESEVILGELVEGEEVVNSKTEDEILEGDFKEVNSGGAYVVSERINGRLLGPNESLLLPRNERIKRAFEGLTLLEYSIVLQLMLKDKSFVSRWLIFAELNDHKYTDGIMNSLNKVSKMTDKEFQALQKPEKPIDSNEEVIDGELVEDGESTIPNQPKLNPEKGDLAVSETNNNPNRSEQFSKNGNKVDQNEIEMNDTENLVADEALMNETQRTLNFGGITNAVFAIYMKNAAVEKDPLNIAMTILKHNNPSSNSPADKFAVRLYATVEKFAADPRSKAQQELADMYVEFGNSESGERMEVNQIIKELNRTGRYEESEEFTRAIGQVIKEIDANFRGRNIGEQIKTDEKPANNVVPLNRKTSVV